MNTTFLQAAASYYGLGETNTRKSEVFTENGEMIFIVEVRVSAEDMIAIARRMDSMLQEQVESTTDTRMHADHGAPLPSDDELRHAYNLMTPKQRGAYGSFARFRAMCGIEDPYQAVQSEGTDGRKVMHVDADQEEPEERIVRACWVKREHMQAHQFGFASDERMGCYLLHPDILTPEQRARYVQQGEQP